MPFDIRPYETMDPEELRRRIRKNEFNMPTAGMCRGYAQANLVILPATYAEYFEERGAQRCVAVLGKGFGGISHRLQFFLRGGVT